MNSIKGEINYAGPMSERAWIEADIATNVPTDTRVMDIFDGRSAKEAPNIEREGFQIVTAPTRVADYRDQSAVDAVYDDDMRRFMAEFTGADHIVSVGSTLLRFGERSAEVNRLNTTAAARMAHSDVSKKHAEMFASAFPPPGNRRVKRAAQHNIWRTFSAPPQDVPLALCDARTVAADDLMVADFRSGPRQRGGTMEFEVLFAKYNPAHRWMYFSNMLRDEAIIFKRFDTDDAQPSYVPHTGFTHPDMTDEWEPRASIEFRTIAYWYE